MLMGAPGCATAANPVRAAATNSMRAGNNKLNVCREQQTQGVPGATLWRQEPFIASREGRPGGEGRLFPVKDYYLEDALRWTGFELNQLQDAVRREGKEVLDCGQAGLVGRCPPPQGCSGTPEMTHHPWMMGGGPPHQAYHTAPPPPPFSRTLGGGVWTKFV